MAFVGILEDMSDLASQKALAIDFWRCLLEVKYFPSTAASVSSRLGARGVHPGRSRESKGSKR